LDPTGVFLAQRYQIQQRIGRGGMGVVYLGIDTKTQDKVAVKFIPDAIKSDEAAISELRSETRKGRRLTHRNIVSILELLDDNGEDPPAIIMEYIDGPTLSALRIKQPGQIFEVDARFKDWVDQLLNALDYAHETARIVHRDLKPANIMVNSAGVLKVADFGIACSMRDSVSRVSVSQNNSAGTLLYMSPQQYMGRVPCESDDIYALGATLYELLTGKPPFHSGKVEQQLKEKIPPSVADRRAELGVKGAPIPPAWETVIAACLEKQPQNRPISITAIRAGLAGEPFERGAKTLRGTILRPGMEPTPPAPSTTTQQAAPVPAAKPSALPGWLPYAAAAVVLIGSFGYYQHSQEQDRRMRREREVRLAERAAQQRLRAEAQDKLSALESALDEARSYEESDASPQEKLAKYQSVVSEYSTFDYPFDDSEKQLLQDARDKAEEWKNLISQVQAAYEKRLTALKEDLRDVEGKIRGSNPPMAAKARADLYNALLSDHSGFVEGFGTEHVALFAKIEKAIQDAEAEDKTTRPTTLHPATMAISDPRVLGWKDYGRTELLKKVQTLLMAEPGLNRPVVADGKWNQATQDALLAYQDLKKLPPTGKVDLTTVNALGLQAYVAGMEPTEPRVLLTGNSSKSGKSSGSGGSGRNSGSSRPSSAGSSQPASSGGSRWADPATLGDFIMKAGIGVGASGIRPPGR
jgi:hypothetical protein